MPTHIPRCDCEEPGYFGCGVPGVLAHLENGRVEAGFQVERCDQCRRYPSDAAAEAKLRELGLISGDASPSDASLQTYSVHCYVTVRVKLAGIPAEGQRQAAKKAMEAFDWDRYQGEAEFAEEFTEFLVDIDGDEDFSRSKRFNADLEPVQS